MPHRLFVILSVLLCVNVSAQDINSSSASAKPSFDQIIEKTLPAVVSLQVETDAPQHAPSSGSPGGMVPKHSAGSAFFISPNGLAVTNAHVVKDAKTILVSMQDGHETTAYVVGLDIMTDIAIIKASLDNTHFIPLAVSQDDRVGDQVFAIGNSFGLPQTVTSGIISALHRTVTSHRVEDFIQTDTPINMGNSGGPLLNKDGVLVGVNNMIIGVAGGNNGVGFAIPTNIVKNVSEQIIKYGATKPGQLGVISQNVSPDLAKVLNCPVKDGALISEVVPGTPAAKAGLRAKDIITKINNDTIHSSDQLRSVVYTQRAGTDIDIVVFRDGKQVKTSLATRAAHESSYLLDEKPTHTDIFDGTILVSHESLSPDGSLLEGIRVVDIQAGSKGWLAGLYPGDIIVKINQDTVKKIADLTKLKTASMKKPYLVEVMRGAHTLFLVITD